MSHTNSLLPLTTLLDLARRWQGRVLRDVFVFCGVTCTLGFAQMLETESARLLAAGRWKIGGAFEPQFASEGAEYALPLSIEYGVTDRLEFLLEPVVYTAIRPKQGTNASGFGDIESTLTFRFNDETDYLPAFAFAGEVKVPTANNDLIGTKKFDYAGYLIASKRFGDLDVHVNVGYTVVGDPAGVSLDNIFNFALGGKYKLTPEYDLFGEVLATTSTGQGQETTSSGSGLIVPEAPTGEVVGTLGIAKHVNDDLLLYFAASDDNNGAVQLRIGFTLGF